MKKMIVVIAAIAMVIGCKSKSNKSTEPVQDTPVVETPIQPEQDTASMADTTAAMVVEIPKVYTTLVLDNNALPVELYESDTIVLPSDSILVLAGIVVTREGTILTVKSDSSIIPNDVTFAYDGKGKVLITQFGKITEYSSKNFSMNNGIISIGDKEIVPEKVLTVLKIGVPKMNPVIFNGSNTNYTSSVQLGKVEVNATGKSSISLSSLQSGILSIKGGSTISIDYAGTIEKVAVSDSANVSMKLCDSIYTASVVQKGKLRLPEKTPIAKEKTNGEGDIVKQ